ncbi:MAG: T9SS type A sorting domain-containing protein [Bacteroidales bacterium]|nr:T9SS type A sorting domain-containing protein [Bacteroidales bacterium]
MKSIFTILLSLSLLQIHAQIWRSSLYPVDWTGGYSDGEGRFLHDFSFAGYHYGEMEIPEINENIIDVTQAPYNADSTGTSDATSAIQSAIDDASGMGGGVVYLPEGIYRLSAAGEYGLWIYDDNIILRGDGPDKTFIRNDETVMRNKNVIQIKAEGNNNWYSPAESPVPLYYDAYEKDTVIYLDETSSFEIGDVVVLTTDFTDEFIAEHLMTGKWNGTLPGVAFCRTITDIDNSAATITIDVPLRYYLKTRDNARVYKIGRQLREVGLENFSVGNNQNTNSGWGENDYNVPGTGAYEVHNSHVINISYSRNCWVKNVHTFKPVSNTGDFHVLSNALIMYQSRLITIDSCILQKTQYEGGGGNGYIYTLRGNECLIKNSQAIHGRHNFDFKSAFSSGNVIHNCLGKDSKYASDFHMHLSMSNMFDCITVDRDNLESAYRPYGTIEHGHTTTQSVFWNTYGEEYKSGVNNIIKSEQWGYGYVIGTQGNATNVVLSVAYNTAPQDLLEGEGTSQFLRPVSLYIDQLKRRMYGTDSVDHSENGATDISLAEADNPVLNIFPNPASEIIKIKADTYISCLQILNIVGVLMYEKNDIFSKETEIRIEDLPDGIYILNTEIEGIWIPKLFIK